MWEIHKLVCDWVKFADQKAGAILAVQGAVASFAMPAIISHAKSLAALSFVVIPMAGSLVACVFSCHAAMRVIMPRLSVGAPESNIFFDHISRRYDAAEKFRKKALGSLCDESRVRDDLAHQIWANARVASAKHGLVGMSLVWLTLGMVLALTATVSNFVYLALRE